MIVTYGYTLKKMNQMSVLTLPIYFQVPVRKQKTHSFRGEGQP